MLDNANKINEIIDPGSTETTKQDIHHEVISRPINVKPLQRNRRL